MPWAKDIDNRIKDGKVVWLGKQKMKAGLKLNKKSCKTVIISAPPPHSLLVRVSTVKSFMVEIPHISLS